MSKGLAMKQKGTGLQWLKSLWNLIVTTAPLLSIPVIAVAAGAAFRWLSSWGPTRTPVPNWLLVGVSVLAVGCLMLLTWRVVSKVRSRTKRLFKPFNVNVIEFDHLWRIKVQPSYWIELNFDDCAEEYLDSLVTGPLHARKGCAAPLFLQPANGAMAWASTVNADAPIEVTCRRCGQDTPVKAFIKNGQQWSRRAMQRSVLKELQRIYVTGGRIKPDMNISLLTQRG